METLNFNDKRYTVVRIIKLESLVDDAEALLFKSHCHAETILKREGKYYFVNEITEVEPIIEEKPSEPIKTPEMLKPAE